MSWPPREEHLYVCRGPASPSASPSARATYKIIVALRDAQTAADVRSNTEIIAATLPNEPGVGQHRWTDCVTSIAAIEKETGYDFLSSVREGVKRAVERRVAEGP